ncbi:hypothetical protein B0H16DRAFT_1486844 [Mycena metata]|uniref:Uncharacterized protein n=1 Tax=Mycena metata TaxID=1033252 RepID=A0AAD7GHC0_9AGAR|nr:hypothetical protein B0H16DRAFT_1486844 [Mycena metata]
MDNTLQQLRGYMALGPNSASQAIAGLFASRFFVSSSYPSPACIETEVLLNPLSPLKDQPPPLDILLYTIRTLLARASSSSVNVPDLLDLATSIESYRKMACQKVDEALDVHDFSHASEDTGAELTDEEGSGTDLTEEEVKRLRDYQTTDRSLRAMYIGLVLKYSQLNIYEMCTTSVPLRAADIALRLSEYFPESKSEVDKDAGAGCPRLFHMDLSDAERELLRLCGVNSHKFARDSYQCAGSDEISRQALTSVLQADSIEPLRLQETMESYVDAVEAIFKDLQEMWGN